MRNFKSSEREVFSAISGNKIVMQLLKKPINTVILIIATSLLLACGGGGSGGGGSVPSTSPTTTSSVDPIVYSGNVNQAGFSADNVEHILAAVMGNSGAATVFSMASARGGDPSPVLPVSRKANAISLLSELNLRLIGEVSNSLSGSQQSDRVSIASTIVDSSEPCDSSDGRIDQTGTIDEGGRGEVRFNFINCMIEGDRADGTIIVSVRTFDFNYLLPVDSVFDFQNLVLRGNEYDITLGGRMQSQIDVASPAETLTVDLVLFDNTSQQTEKFENVVVVSQYLNGLGSNQFSQTIDGRFYDPVHGYVDVSSTAPMFFSGYLTEYPESGGPLIISGANQGRLTVTPQSRDIIFATVDLDGDGTLDYRGTLSWTGLDDAAQTINVAPIANAGADFTATSADIQLDANLSQDTNMDLLKYSWAITKAPAGSQAVVQNATAPVSTVVLSIPGSYEFTLTVTDSHGLSGQDTITVKAPAILLDPHFAPVANVPYGARVAEMPVVGDVSGDGLDDVVISTSLSSAGQNDQSTVIVVTQTNTGQLGSPTVYSVGLQPSTYHIKSVAINDLNNDGLNDVVYSHDSAIGVLLQNNLALLDPVTTIASNHASFANVLAVRTGDFNNDGLQDVVSIDNGAQFSDVDIYPQKPDGTLNAPVTWPSFHGGHDTMDVGDMNNDGLSDIVIQSGQRDGGFTMLLQQADGSFTSVLNNQMPTGYSFTDIAVGDVNNDGLNDIVVNTWIPTENCPCMFIMHQNGPGTFSPPVTYPISDHGPIAIADMDNDGKNDILINQDYDVALYLQQNSGDFSREDLYPVTGSIYNGNRDNIAVGDVNGDGNLDALVVAPGNLRILYGLAP